MAIRTVARAAALTAAAAAAGIVGVGTAAADDTAPAVPLGPLQQSSTLIGSGQQSEDSKVATWTLMSTVADPQGMMVGSPISGYGLSPWGSFGCFLFVCNATPFH